MSSAASGVELIAVERRRQIEAKGWTPEHDDGHVDGELARAAACYALGDGRIIAAGSSTPLAPSGAYIWPWAIVWWKPSRGDRLRELAKAGALIAAEIDRLQRAEQ